MGFRWRTSKSKNWWVSALSSSKYKEMRWHTLHLSVFQTLSRGSKLGLKEKFASKRCGKCVGLHWRTLFHRFGLYAWQEINCCRPCCLLLNTVISRSWLRLLKMEQNNALDGQTIKTKINPRDKPKFHEIATKNQTTARQTMIIKI